MTTDKIALVTGANKGIGFEIARQLADLGWTVVAAARDKSRDLALDVTSAASIAAGTAEVAAAYGRLDVLVNNAGVGIGSPMEEIQTKHLDMQLAVNLRALILGTREGLPMLRAAGAEHGKALIVNTASIAGKGGQAWLSIYAATKAAVINFTQSTHREVGNGGGHHHHKLGRGKGRAQSGHHWHG